MSGTSSQSLTMVISIPYPVSNCLSSSLSFSVSISYSIRSSPPNLSSDPSGIRFLPFRSLSYPICTHSSPPILHESPFIQHLPPSLHRLNRFYLPPLPPALCLNPRSRCSLFSLLLLGINRELVGDHLNP